MSPSVLCALPLRKICVTKAIVRDCWHLKWTYWCQVILEVAHWEKKGTRNSSLWGAVCLSVTQPPLWSYFSPFQKGTIFQNSSLREPFWLHFFLSALIIMNAEGCIHFQIYLVNFAVLHSMILKDDKHLLQYDLPLESGPEQLLLTEMLAFISWQNHCRHFISESKVEEMVDMTQRKIRIEVYFYSQVLLYLWFISWKLNVHG